MGESLLKWDTHNFTVLKTLYSYCLKEELTDAILCFQDGEIRVHKIVLSACSPKLEKLFKEGRDEIHFCNVSKSSMDYLLEFMYRGHVLVPSDALPGVLAAADYFQVKGIQTIQNNEPQEGPEQQQLEAPSNCLQKKQTSRNNSIESYCLPSSPLRRDRPKSVPKTMTTINEKQSNDLSAKKDTSGEALSSPDRLDMSDITFLPVQKRKLPSKSTLEVFPSRKQQPPKSTKVLQNGNNSESSRMKQAGPKEPTKVINPFARKQPSPAPPADSDATFVDGVASLEADSVVVVKVEPKDATEIVIDDDSSPLASSTRVRHSSEESELLFDAPSTSSTARRRRPAKTPGDRFRSSEEEVEVDEEDTSRKKKRKKAGENPAKKDVPKVFVNTLVRKPDNCDPKKVKKYKELLVKKPLNDMHHFCTSCFDVFDDISAHIKRLHRKMPREMHACPKCDKRFYDKKFVRYHWCVVEEDAAKV